MPSLPKVETPTFAGKIPSSKKSFEFRPFLVKEQKALLFALESGELEQIYLAFKNIISACTKDAINVDAIPSFDAESVFLQISSKSIGETSKIEVKCSHCEEFIKMTVNIPDVTLKGFKTSGSTIQLTDRIGLKMKYPSMKDVVDVSIKSNKTKSDETQSPQTKAVYDTIIASIDSIFDENNVYPAKDYKYEELNAFLDNLSIEQINRVEGFFEKAPYLSLDLDFKCPKCGEMNSQEIRGIKNFF